MSVASTTNTKRALIFSTRGVICARKEAIIYEYPSALTDPGGIWGLRFPDSYQYDLTQVLIDQICDARSILSGHHRANSRPVPRSGLERFGRLSWFLHLWGCLSSGAFQGRFGDEKMILEVGIPSLQFKGGRRSVDFKTSISTAITMSAGGIKTPGEI